MSFLLDTNVISEPMKPRPNSGVVAWLAQVDEDSVFISVVTITELRYGVERLSTGRRRTLAGLWFGSAAWKCSARDGLIGWTAAQREANL